MVYTIVRAQDIEERNRNCMWSIGELKMRGKLAMKANYWATVLVAAAAVWAVAAE